MKRLLFGIALALALAVCGWVLIGNRGHKEIRRRVQAPEVIGRWVLTTNSLNSARARGFFARPGEQIAITVRSDGSYASHTVQRYGIADFVTRIDEQGHWSLEFTPTNEFRNTLALRSLGPVSPLHVARDSQRIVLWSSWRESETHFDLVYEKAQEEVR
jgi:hypothetical protein